MKHFILCLTIVGTCLFSSCTKEIISPLAPALTENQHCELSVSLNELSATTSTKVTGATDNAEVTIQNVQIFVFRANPASNEAEVLDACVSKGFDKALNYVANTAYNDIKLNCTVGNRSVWVVVNAPKDFCADGSVKTKADLLAKTSSLSEHSSNSLLMIGEKNMELSAGTSKAEIQVTRMCAKVVLNQIKNEMEAEAYQGADCFRIKDIYLTNVPAVIDYNGTRNAADLSEDKWYARRKKESDPNKYKLILDSQSAVTLNYGNTYSTRHTFYTFPNECAPNESESWSPRATRLVVEAEFYDGANYHTCYYPINLYKEESSKGISRNCQYNVSLTVKRPGSDDPDKKVQFNTMTGYITVADWDTGESYTEVI